MATVVGAPASAEPAAGTDWRFGLSSIAAGVNEGAELAIDPVRRKIFVADGDDYFQRYDVIDYVLPYPHVLMPKVSVLDVDSRRVLRAIDYTGLPLAPMKYGPLTIPVPHTPNGVALDTKRGLVITTTARGEQAAVVDMSARAAKRSDLAVGRDPLKHAMGVAVDTDLGRAYIGSWDSNQIVVVDTATRREITTINGVYKPTMVAVDSERHRAYVGNADYEAKKINFLTVVDTRTNRVVKKIATAPNSRPSVDPTTGRIYLASFVTGEIAVIDPDSLNVVGRIQTKSTPVNVAIDEKRRLAYTANLFKRTISVVDLASNKVIATLKTRARPHTIAVDPKTGAAFATEFQSSRLTVVSPRRG